MSSKLAQVRRIVEDYVDTDSIARKLVEIGFILPSKKIVTAGVSGRELMLSSKRFYVLDDSWIRDEYLSYHWNKAFDWSPENLEKHIPWQPGQDHAASLSDKTHLVRQPSRFEWHTLMDLKKYNPAIIEAAKILNLKTDDWYFTEEDLTPAGYPGYARIVNIKAGFASDDNEDYDNYVRPVRLSQ
jgi:hypothetical protein